MPRARAIALISAHRSAYWDDVKFGLGPDFQFREFALEEDSIGAFAARILNAMPARFAAVGACLGGYAILEMLETAPDRLESLALIGVSPQPDAPWRAAERQRRITRLEAKIAGGGENSDATVSEILPWMISRNGLKIPGIAARAERALASIDAATLLRQQRAAAQRNAAAWKMKFRPARALIIVGEEDRICERADAAVAAQALTNGELHIIPGCGHMVPIECPEQVSRLLLKWLQDLPEP